MTWTREPPTVPGWYWVRGPAWTGVVSFDGLSCKKGGSTVHWSPSELGAEWYGPLEPPT